MAIRRGTVDQDYIIERVTEIFQCRVLWSEGRPCLEYKSARELDQISEYVQAHFEVELLDVFFTAVESLPAD
ncbi:hypothetical protein YSY43_20250 [Paenibacillus sp. YSY-4.3]